MTDIIDFLERAGQDAQFRYASQGEVEQALTRAEIAPALQTAVLAKDQPQLEELLGQISLSTVYFPGNEDDGKGEEDEDEDEKNPPKKSGGAPEHGLLQAAISAD